MSNKTRKRIWPVSLVMAVAIVGIAAAFLTDAGRLPRRGTQAHDGASGSTQCNETHSACSGISTTQPMPRL